MSARVKSFLGSGGGDVGDFLEIGDNSASGFRHRLQNMPEEDEDLTEAFKARLGLIKADDLKASVDVHEIEMMNEVEKEATLSKYKFKQFVENHYKLSHLNFTKEPLKEPLLNLPNGTGEEVQSDNLSAVVISHAIKHFCKDITLNNKPSNNDPTSVLVLVNNNLELLRKSGQKKENATDRTVSVFKKLQQKHKSKNKTPSLEQLVASIPTSDLETAQFIVSYGLLSKNLRDEIYCQLCNQVSNNPSGESSTCGWVLHVLCAGCYMPTSKLLRYYVSFLKDFVDEKGKDYAKQVLTLLHRVNSFGMRFHPPNSLEFLAVKTRKKIMLPVLLADGSVIPVLSDSATTASEMCHIICKAANLKDQFGFAVYISVTGKVSSLGNGLDHVMDAIAECEQVLKMEKMNGKQSTSSELAAWQLSFGKELFTPWHDAELDPKSSDLVYKQICQSVQNGEFRFKSDEDLARFVARRCFVEFGSELNKRDVKPKVKDLVPKTMSGQGNFKEDYWLDLIFSALDKMDLKSKKYSQLQILWSIVEGAQRKWPLQFSALFEVVKVSGPPLSSDKLIVAVSCRGIYLFVEPYSLLCGLHYYEIVEATYGKPSKGSEPTFCVTTIKGDEWKFASNNSQTITKLLCTFLDGLRRRSKWAVAIEEFILRDHSKNESDDFHLRHGDVVELLDEAEQAQLKEDWMHGKCERTGKVGSFPFDSIYILPTCEKPPKSFLNLFSGMNKSDFNTLPRKRGAIVLAKSTVGKSQNHGMQSAI